MTDSKAATSETAVIEPVNDDAPSAVGTARRRVRRRRRIRTKSKKSRLMTATTLRSDTAHDTSSDETTRKGRVEAEAEPKVDYDAAVAEGRRIVADIEGRRMRLGQLADQVATGYGDESLKRFAVEIGIKAVSLERCRSVFRAWKGKKAPAPKSYSVAQELQAYPDRFELLKNNPDMSKREARKLRGERREDDSGPQRKNAKRWFRDVVRRAVQVLADTKFSDDTKFLDGDISPELRRDLREIIDFTQLPTLQKAGELLQEEGERLIGLVAFCEQLVAEEAPNE
jgi:hypothetical protein